MLLECWVLKWEYWVAWSTEKVACLRWQRPTQSLYVGATRGPLHRFHRPVVPAFRVSDGRGDPPALPTHERESELRVYYRVAILRGEARACGSAGSPRRACAAQQLCRTRAGRSE